MGFSAARRTRCRGGCGRRYRRRTAASRTAARRTRTHVVAEFWAALGHLVATLQLGDDDSTEWRTVYGGGGAVARGLPPTLAISGARLARGRDRRGVR